MSISIPADFEARLDGVTIGPFRPSKETLDSMTFEGEIAGVKVFTSPKCPPGTIEIWDGYGLAAVISGVSGPIRNERSTT